MAYSTLNRLKWTGRMDGCEIVILHRGAPGDRKRIPGIWITELKKSYLHYRDPNTRRETCIPLHRVLEIRLEGKAVWKRGS